VHVSAAVASCASKLDQSTKDAWYALAKRVVAFVSADPTVNTPQLVKDGPVLRNAVNATMADLKAKGCGDVAAQVLKAPPPVAAPAHMPGDKVNPWTALFQGDVPIWLIALGLYFLTRYRR
jgi:hypothetical protein